MVNHGDLTLLTLCLTDVLHPFYTFYQVVFYNESFLKDLESGLWLVQVKYPSESVVNLRTVQFFRNDRITLVKNKLLNSRFI